MACREGKKDKNPCSFFKNREKTAKTQTWEPLDIEELHNYGKEKGGCPYYAMKDRSQGADIIFMPYNYLINVGIRK
jgi:hypothetical protein